MNAAWFRRWGWLYRPAAAAGWAVTLLALAFAANCFIAVDRHSHSASDTLYGVFPFWAPTFLLWLWIAGRADGLGRPG